MKGSKLFLVLFLLSSNLLFSQEKNMGIQFGIGQELYQLNRKYIPWWYDSTITIIDKEFTFSPNLYLSYFFTNGKIKHNLSMVFSPFIFENYVLLSYKNGEQVDRYDRLLERNNERKFYGFGYLNNIKINKKISTNVGVRLMFDDIEYDKPKLKFIPVQIGLNYQLTPKLFIYMNTGTSAIAFRRTDWIEYTNKIPSNKYDRRFLSSNFSIGVNYCIDFKKESQFNIQPNKTYQF